MTSDKKIIVSEDQTGLRLDVLLSKELGCTRSQVQKMIRYGQILVNGRKPGKMGEKTQGGAVIEMVEAEKPEVVVEEKPEATEVEVIKETDDYLVVNKPAGLLVHPTEAEEPVSLVSWLLEKYPEVSGVGENEKRPGIVHRLDKEASGLLVVAKTQEMFVSLKNQFKEREVDKEYSVLVYGKMEKDNGVIDFSIDRGNDGRMAARPRVNLLKLKNVDKVQSGKEALTEFWVETEFARFSLLKVKTYSGRSHQIRVHMLAYGHPVIGDGLYFNKKLIKRNEQKLDRLFLHADKLCFTDLSGEENCYTVVLPEQLASYLSNLN